jgi:aspartyl protease/PDZ domain-containing protein
VSSSWKRWAGAASWLVLALLTGSRADAAIDAKSKTVIDRYLKVTGGASAWQRDSTMHAHFHVKAFGLEGTVDRWVARPDRSVTSTRLGPLSLSEGTSDGKAWRIDQNGKMQWLDGTELTDALAGNYVDQELWAASNQGGGTIRFLRREGTGSAAVDVLQVAPPQGKPRELSFAVDTSYLVKTLQTSDAQTVVTTLSQYDDLGGRKRAMQSLAQVQGMPANDVTITADSLRAGVVVDGPLFLPPAGMAKDYRFLGSGKSAVVPMRYAERHVWLKVSVNGEPAQDFLLDTGASVTVLDSAYAAKLGLVTHGSLQGTGAGSSGQFAFTSVNTIHVEGAAGSGIELTSQHVVVAPLSKYLKSYFWRDTPGVLGYDFLSRFVNDIDYEKQTLTFSDPEGFQYTGKGQAIPISFSEGVPVVHAKVDGVEGDFRLDVGSGSSVDLHTPFVEKNGFRSKAKKTIEAPGAGFGGTFEMDMARLSSFQVGSYVIADPIVGLTRTQTGTFSGTDFAGNVGNRILDRFHCTFDYTRKVVYLEPDGRFGKRDDFGQFGAQMMMQGDQIVVGYVAAGTPAATSGLEVGDVVNSINGKDSAGLSIDDIFPLLEDSPPGTEITLNVSRHGESRIITVRMAPTL